MDNNIAKIYKYYDISSLLFIHSTIISFGDEYKFIKYTCVICLFIYLFMHHSFETGDKRSIKRLINLFAISVIVSGIYGDIIWGDKPGHINCYSSILLAMQIVISFAYINYAAESKKTTVIRNSIFVNLLFYVTITDLYVLYNNSSIVDDASRIFIIGNKFFVSYLNLLCFALLFSFDKCRLIFKLLFGLLSLYVSVSVYCSTGIVGNILMFSIVMSANLYKRILKYSFQIILIVLIIPILFFVLIKLITNTNLFVEFINLLGENENLTGRTIIYASVFDKVIESPWFGYGNGNSPIIVSKYIGFGNSQNGIIENIINWGAISVSIFILMILKIISSYNIHRYNSSVYFLLLIMILMSSVEITLGLMFIVDLALFVLVSKIPSNTCSKRINSN